MHPKADDFCRELSLRSLFDCSVIGAAIVYPDSNTDITVVGRYGSQEIAGSLTELKEAIENATRRKHLESIAVVRDVGGVAQVALIPSPPTASTAGVICIFFSDESAEIAIDLEHRWRWLLRVRCTVHRSGASRHLTVVASGQRLSLGGLPA